MASISTLIHGRKPEVADFIPTDPLEELNKLITGEIKDWPQIEQLSNLYQTYMLGAFEQAIPGFGDILRTGGEDTQAILDAAQPLLRGEVPEDVARQVFRSSAFQSLGAGTLGGPMGSALSARNLGLTSLDMMKQGTAMTEAGTNAAQRWQQIASGTILPPSSQLYSPEWFSTFMAQQRAAKQATQQLKYNVAAAPDPAWADRAKLLATYGGIALGGGMGGGGGGGAGASMNSYQSSFGSEQAPPAAPPAAPAGDYKSVIAPQASYFNQYPYYG